MAAAEGAPLREIYRLMVLTRRLDQEAVALQRQGELTAFPPMTGQEAAQVASAYAAGPDDFCFPSYRELGVAVARGIDLVGYLVAYRGHWNGGAYDPVADHFAPISSAVGAHALHGTGWAMGAALDGKRAAALIYFGDGATSEGDVHEALNFAGVFRAPAVFIVQNNRWAISVPVERQTAAPIWTRAAGYGMEGVQVDGNDAGAVYEATRAALDRARDGAGPSLIEALTYRLGAHSTADDPTRYRQAADVEPWRALDPIPRLSAELQAPAEWFAEVDAWAAARVGEIRAALISTVAPDPEEMFEFAYARPGPLLAAEREWHRIASDA